jgi:transcription antitermination factor NusG
VPDAEIDAIQRLGQSGRVAVPHPYLKEGQRVRITRGPMTDVEGFLVRHDARKGLLVLSVNLVRASVAVEVDVTMVTAA